MDTKINTNVDLLAKDVTRIQTDVTDHVDEMPRKVDNLAEQLNNQRMPVAMENEAGSPLRKKFKSVWSGFNEKVNMPHNMAIHAKSLAPNKLNADDRKTVKINLKSD